MKTTYGLPKKREEVLDALQVAYSQQNLDDAEYERRLDLAMQADCIETLEEALSDFPEEVKRRIFPPASVPARKTRQRPAASAAPVPVKRTLLSEARFQPTELNEQPCNYFAALSSQEIDLRGAYCVGKQFTFRIECILGETKLDLRNEALEGAHIDIWISGALGDVKILLPPGTRVEQDMQIVGGDLKVRKRGANWLKRIIGNTPEEPENVSPATCTLALHGSFWLGTIKLITS